MTNANDSINFDYLLNIGEFFVKGSEAYIYFGNFLGKKVIIKERRPKAYRHEKLDFKLRSERIKLETRVLTAALNSDIPVPAVLGVNPKKFQLILEYVEGSPLGKLLETPIELKKNIILLFFEKLGELTGKLHSQEIVHGDLTIFNVIINGQNELTLIDFGLSYITDEIEPLASDINIFESSLRAFNPEMVELWFNSFLKGYKSNYNNADRVLSQLKDILSRGRYILKRKQDSNSD
ncbi:MAG: putative bifunctional tRNA threonylcarbamoyladenosine biosynthesis protein [Candidatus Heimdallarchaeota archaeon LC_3]|nr:MAG: putative bifunctional tRNA threonylcarbamoyladenosine biosynthesis protein [Candidatus Heimdallarchaeota archaeon LC_3]